VRATRALRPSCSSSTCPQLVALAVRESGKTPRQWAIGEVREAVDYLRYYAARIRSEFKHASASAARPRRLHQSVEFSVGDLHRTGRRGAGRRQCRAGKSLLSRAVRSRLRAVQLLHEAGVPDVRRCSCCRETARRSARGWSPMRACAAWCSPARPPRRVRSRAAGASADDVPLIAETGGQNAMIVDSTALPEQVVATCCARRSIRRDSAARRCGCCACSARSPTPVLTMLEGAMRELRVGRSGDIATDVGPLIDEQARARIEAHLQEDAAQHALPQSAVERVRARRIRATDVD
jgi:RHH-type proline utilization regulon transcriptional repressor/proline dehydrogenase/delta 1-pyrroline-5-carboxylate dehydrogenase